MTWSDGRGGPEGLHEAHGDSGALDERQVMPLVRPDRWWAVVLAFVVTYAIVHAGSNALRREWFAGDAYWSMTLSARVAWFMCSGALAAGVQWIILRRDFPLTGWWVVATASGTGVVVAFLDPLLASLAPSIAHFVGGPATLVRYVLAQAGGCIYGLTIAVPQALVLQWRGVIHAGWWCLAATAGAVTSETFNVAYVSYSSTVGQATWPSYVAALFANALQGLPLAVCFLMLRRRG